MQLCLMRSVQSYQEQRINILNLKEGNNYDESKRITAYE